MVFNTFLLKVRRAETPFYRRLKGWGKAVLTFQLPVPRFLDPVFKLIRALQLLHYETKQRLFVSFYGFPLLRAACVSIGERLQMEVLPDIVGTVKVYLGDDVRLSGWFMVVGGRVFPESEFKVGNRTFIGTNCLFSVAKSIVIGDDVLIASGCNLSDYSAHPVHPERRIAGEQVDPDDVRPIRIENKAWLGRGAVILPGVTIGEGAVVGAATVVTKDVPAGRICVGNPGRILSRTVYESRRQDLTTALEREQIAD